MSGIVAGRASLRVFGLALILGCVLLYAGGILLVTVSVSVC